MMKQQRVRPNELDSKTIMANPNLRLHSASLAPFLCLMSETLLGCFCLAKLLK
jgi:hypothetical protein